MNLVNLIDKDLISSVNQIQLKTDNQFMNMKVLPSLNEDTVSLVYQLMIFSKSEHCFIHIIISQCCDFLQFITEHYINSSLSQYSFSSSYSTFENSIFQREKSVDFDLLEFQASWFLNNRKFKIRKAQINFLIITAYILNHFFYLSWQRLKSFLFISMSDEAFSNNLDARIEIII